MWSLMLTYLFTKTHVISIWALWEVGILEAVCLPSQEKDITVEKDGSSGKWYIFCDVNAKFLLFTSQSVQPEIK